MHKFAVLATLIALSTFSLGGAAFAQDEGDGEGGQDSPPAPESPAAAQDVAGMTCGAFFASDEAHRTDNLNSILNFVKDTSNSAVVGTAATILQDATLEAAMQLIEKSCEGQKDDVNLISVLN